MLLLNNIVSSALVLSCVVLAHGLHTRPSDRRMFDDTLGEDAKTNQRSMMIDRIQRLRESIVTPSPVIIGKVIYPNIEASTTTTSLVDKWKAMYEPAKGSRVEPLHTDSVPPRHPDESSPDDEDGDDNEVFLKEVNGSGSGSGSDDEFTTPETAITPTINATKESFCGTVDVHADPNEDTVDPDSDDAVFGQANNDWIEGNDDNLGDDVFGKVNSTWTWGRLPESSLDQVVISATVIVAFKLTPTEQLQMKEAAVQALRVLTMSPCAGPRRQDPQCKILKDIIRDLTLLGLVFTSGRS